MKHFPLPESTSALLCRGSAFFLFASGILVGVVLTMGILDSTRAQSSTDVLINPSGGNVGIGTMSPESNLHIVHDVNTEEAQIRLDGPTDNNSTPVRIVLRPGINSIDRTWAGIMAVRDGLSSYRSRLEFQTTDQTLSQTYNATTKMTVTADGKVGIGTTSPDHLVHTFHPDDSLIGGFKLESHGGGAITLLGDFDNDGTDADSYITIRTHTSATDWSFGVDDGDNDEFQFTTRNGLSGSEVLTIQRDGTLKVKEVITADGDLCLGSGC